MDDATKGLITPLRDLGEACGYEACPYYKEGMLNVHIVPHTHGELGYTRTFYQHYTGNDDFYDKSNINMKRILDFTISELWDNVHRTFTFSDLPYLYHWWSNRDATVRRMVYQLLRQGRLFIVGGGWGMPDEAGTSYSNIIDQFTFSLRKQNATFGTCGRPLVAWQADVFGHSREFTSLAALMGFDGLFISPISFDDEVGRMQRKELEMIWRGSDDLGTETDIFTHKLFDGYWAPPGFCFSAMCSDPVFIVSDEQFSNVEERVNSFVESVKHRQSPHYATANIMVVMGMRMGYHDAAIWFKNIDELIARVNERTYKTGEKIHLMYSSPPCYLKAVQIANPTLPIKQDDFMPVAYDRATHLTGMYTSRPTIKYMLREGHIFLQIAKQMQVLARLYKNDDVFEEFNWIMGVMQDHNILTGSMRAHVKNYYTHKMYLAVQRSTLLLKKAFNKLRNSPTGTIYYRCSFNESSCYNLNGPRSFIVVYNPLAWPVTMPVRLPVAKARFQVYDPKMEIIRAVVTKIPNSVTQINKRYRPGDHELIFIAKDLPPMGFRSYYIVLTNKKVRRSIIKKIKTKSKKYLTRQTNNLKINDKYLIDSKEYDYFEETTTRRSIHLAAVNGTNDFDNYVMTPKYYSQEESTTWRPIRTSEKTTRRPTTSTTTSTSTSTTSTATEKVVTAPVETEETYFYVVSNDAYIGNKYINMSLGSKNQVTAVFLSNGVKINLKIQMMYYASDDPKKLGRPKEKPPGAYIFKPMDPTPVLIRDKVRCTAYKTDLVQELDCTFSSYANFVIRVYQDSPVMELDWVVGPIPVTDEIGKDVFIRYATDLVNDGVFYTDSNGRQTIKRLRSDRPTYEPVFPDSIAGNFYPITSKIYIEDKEKNIRFSVLNDRAQGGASLYEGQIDMMVHRRILTDDSGIQTYLNETLNDKGIIVRGTHYLYLSKADYKPNKIFEKKLAKEIELRPQILVSPYDAYGPYSKRIWSEQNNEFSGLNKKLPIGVHVLTLQEWNHGTLLLRLENYLEKVDVVRTGVKTVFIKDLFKNITILSVRETTLAGNIWLSDWVPLQWTTKEKFARSFNEFYRGNGSVVYADDNLKTYEEVDINKGIKLNPQQIRTFVARFQYTKT